MVVVVHSRDLGPKLRRIYDQALREFELSSLDLVVDSSKREVSFSAEFELRAVPFMPVQRDQWVSLIVENPWLLGVTYGPEDVPEPYPTPREALRAGTLCLLSDVFISEVDNLFEGVGKEIGRIIDEKPWLAVTAQPEGGPA